MQTGRAVPAYVKRGSNAWDYLGEYRATAYRTDARIIEEFRDTRPSAEVAGILFLECATKITVSVGGGGFADPLTRREVEIAAIDFVTADLIARRFAVHDHQRENRGYDLLAVKADETLRVEVKGTDGPVPRFFLSRNERSCATRDSTWRLAIVTSARRNPALHFMTYAEAEKQFLFDPLAWECTLFGESSQLADKEESSIAPESVALQEPSGSTAP